MTVYSIPERYLRMCIFQVGVVSSSIERMIMWLYCKIICGPDLFNPDLAQKSVDSLVRIGATVGTVVPKDHLAQLQYVMLNSADLERQINGFGAKWDKIVTGDRSVLAITPPHEETVEWQRFKADLLKLKWHEEVIDGVKVIVTCDHADKIEEGQWHQKLFIHSNSASVSFSMLKGRIGFYLGAKQNCCMYDPRGTWKSTGVPSEAGYYNDIEAIYKVVSKGYKKENIWVTSACGGSQAAGYLRSVAPHLNYIFENCSFDTRDFAPKFCLARFIVNTFWGDAVKSRDIPDNVKPKEVGLNLFELWKDLKLSNFGKIIIINPDKDNLLPSWVPSKIVGLARKINKYVSHIVFPTTKKHSHSDRYYTHAEPTRQVLNTIFSQV